MLDAFVEMARVDGVITVYGRLVYIGRNSLPFSIVLRTHTHTHAHITNGINNLFDISHSAINTVRKQIVLTNALTRSWHYMS